VAANWQSLILNEKLLQFVKTRKTFNARYFIAAKEPAANINSKSYLMVAGTLL